MIRLNLAALAVVFSLQPGLVAASASLEQRVERLERVTNNPVILQQAQRIEQQNREIQDLHDQLERMAHCLKQLDAKVGRQNSEIDERLSSLEAKSKTADGEQSFASEKVALTEAAAKTEVSAEEAKLDPKQQYDQAFNLLKESKFEQSIAAFSNFVKEHPNHTLTANGYYWLGESYLMEQNYQQAFAAFDKIIQDFSSSNKLNDGLLRGADSLVGLKKMDEAKAMYQRLIELAPASAAGKTAKRRMDSFKVQN